MRDYTVFDEATGRPLRYGKCPYLALRYQGGEGEIAEEGDYAADYYRDPSTGALALRADLAATIDRTSVAVGQTVSVSGLPTTCSITVDGQPVEITDGVLTFEPLTSGAYIIRVDLVEFKPLRWRVEVS